MNSRFKGIFVVLFSVFVLWSFSFSCDFVVSLDQWYFREWKINDVVVAPWEIICVLWWNRSYLKFIWFHWSLDNPIIIKNYNWVVNINSDHTYWFSIEDSQYIVVDWSSLKDVKYWFKIKAPKAWVVMSVWWGSSDVEISNVEIFGDSINDSYTAFGAKTDPKCWSEFVRWKFEMKNIFFHDSYIHDINQWLYFWWTFFDRKIDCPEWIIQWHTLQWVQIYNNIIERVWQDGMQISSATSVNWQCLIYDNFLKDTSLKDLYWQRSAITIWWWSDCSVYNNISFDSNWPWVLFFGYAWEIYNNLIVNAWKKWEKVDWIFLDHRSWDEYISWSVNIYDNTIINTSRNWIRFYNKNLVNNQIYNNLIVNPWAIQTTHPNHRSMKELWSYLYLEKWRIDRSQINNGADISSYLSTWFVDGLTNLALGKIDNDVFDEIENMKKFWVIEYQKLVKKNHLDQDEPSKLNKKDLDFVVYFVSLIQDKYPDMIDEYKKLIVRFADKYPSWERIWLILMEICERL